VTPDERFSVRNKVVLITGAGRGIGRQMALAFAQAGAKVVVAARTEADVRAVVAEIEALGGVGRGVGVDVTSKESVNRMVGSVIDAFECPDVLVNNAGVYINRAALEMSEDEWDVMADTNMKGAFFCSCRVAAEMAAKGGGSIVTISSVLSRVAQHGYASYGASKAGVEQLTRALAFEWARDGITVNAVSPTSTVTRETAARLSTPEALASAKERIPIGRYCDAEDVIGAVLYLASPAASFVTGQILYVDGGLSL
jgi:NAD(P)-dependent dehydrogenase (short-subunit alcohol dehydrogenase family)